MFKREKFTNFVKSLDRTILIRDIFFPQHLWHDTRDFGERMH